MTNKQKGIFAVVAGIVVLIIGVISIVFAYRFKPESAFDYIKKLGAVASTTFPGSFEFSNYRFFSNNRVARLSDQIKGSYTKEKITWDNGTVTLISDIF